MNDYLAKFLEAASLADAERGLRPSALSKYLDAVPEPLPPYGLFGLSRPPQTFLSELRDVLIPVELSDIAPAVPRSLPVTWAKSFTDQWTYLYDAVSLAPDMKGVYIIWRYGDWRVVRLGQGQISERLNDHWWDEDVRTAAGGAPLLATWTTVHPHLCSGVERFLAEHYKPLVGERFPNAVPIGVNLPS